MKRIHFIIISLGLAISLGFILISNSNKTLDITIFEVENGFGYAISSNAKTIIRQEQIPGIQETKPFCTKHEAKKTANLVRHKILKQENPRITLEELNTLEINYNCLDLH